MRGRWPALLFSIHWHFVECLPVRSKSLLQRNHHISHQDPGGGEVEVPTAERVMEEGAHELKRLMKGGPSSVNIPAMSHDRVPKSPPHKDEISDNDLGEVIDSKAAEYSDVVNAKFVVAGMPMDFPGNTCKQVCTMCVIAAESYPECGCRASCLAGANDQQCNGKIVGWSGDKVTTPKTRWKAKCNAGGIDCKECLDDVVIKKMAKCKKAPIPAVCEHELKMQLAKPDTPIYYCTQDNSEGDGLATCDTFLYEPKENGWTCFDKEWDCKNSKTDIRESLTSHEKNIPTLTTPCVWCSVPIKKSR